MDASQTEELIRRLIDDPHDEEALAEAHSAGEEDPKAYAQLLERVGQETRDPAYAAHWLSESANVWTTTLNDAPRAARLLMAAIERDPTHRTSSERLADLYRERGDLKALVAMLERRAKAMSPMIAGDDSLRAELAALHEEIGRLWSEAPLSQPKKAIEHFRRCIELDETNAFAIFSARELMKTAGMLKEALPLYAAELAIETDSTRKLALMRDEAETRKSLGDLSGMTKVLTKALELEPNDPALRQEYAGSVLDRIQAGQAVPSDERARAVDYLGSLAEEYDGEHGMAYASAALDVDAGDDRAMRLFAKHARAERRDADLTTRAAAYIKANPNGAFASEAHGITGHISPDTTAATAYRKLQSRAPKEAEASPLPLSPVAPSQPPPAAKKESMRPDPLAIFAHETSNDTSAGKRPSNIPPDRLQGILDAAQMMAGKGKKAEALVKYKEILESDPAHPEALSWVEDYLRSKRDYAHLKEVLLASVRALGTRESVDSKKERLREVAGLCETNLRDTDGAINAWRQLIAIDRSDESARNALTRLLERSQRWDDLANLLEQEATIETDIDTKIQLERKLARLQEDKRKDLIGAAEAWSRIARLMPEAEAPVATAAKLYEKSERFELAAQMLADQAPRVEDPIARGNLLERLAQIREQMGEHVLAGDSYAEAAESMRNARMWEEAERLYSSAEGWAKAANAAVQRGQLTTDQKQQAAFVVRASEYWTRAGDEESALRAIELSTDLDPLNDAYAEQYITRLTRAEYTEKLVNYLNKRGDRLHDRLKRVGTRRQAAVLASTRLKDRELTRELWLKVLEDGDDKEALERLIDDAVDREDHTEATTLLRRLSQNTVDKAEKARIALREAELLATGVGDVDTALSRYEEILNELDPTCRPALQAIADLQETRGELPEASEALERELKLLADAVERGQIAGRLARIYEKLEDPKNAIRALDIVRKADLEDFDALNRLCELCEKTGQWDRVAELLAERIEIEGDEEEAAGMTIKLAQILADKLDRGDEALAALTEFADDGHQQVRTAYVDLGDRLGWKGVVAQKLVDWWFDARHNADRTQALRGAFDRFSEVGREQEAIRVAIELVRTRGGDRDLARGLEELCVKTGDHEALTIAHDMLTRELHGAARALELVRQAEVMVRAGVAPQDAIQHGEDGLIHVATADVEPLLERLGRLSANPSEVVDLYERQVSRTKVAADRVRALSRASQIAVERGHVDRARGFFELALSGTPSEETLSLVESFARAGDQASSSDRLRRALVNAMAASGHSARDGGKTRASMLRRAAQIVHRELTDVEQAFKWLAESLVARVQPETLDELETLGIEVNDPKKTEAALTQALSEVFDGPLVRQLVQRRARLRRDQLRDKSGAATDLKRLHDLSPSDHSVIRELALLLIDLADFRGLVQLYEDQILRGRDVAYRAEIARVVARVWEEQLQDARETADAWRRVLRLKASDEEASRGLERAKANQMKRPDSQATNYLLPEPPKAPEPPAKPEPAKTADAAKPEGPKPPRPPSVPPPAEEGSDASTDDRRPHDAATVRRVMVASKAEPGSVPPPLPGQTSPSSIPPASEPTSRGGEPAIMKALEDTRHSEEEKKASDPKSSTGEAGGAAVLDEELQKSLERVGKQKAEPSIDLEEEFTKN